MARRRPLRRLALGRKVTGPKLTNRNPWPVLAVLLLSLGLAVYVFYGQKGTQGDQRRELRKF
ncbi:MAG: hypothetical protein HQ527_09910 [Cyanobacteria bacterium]|nr:hypothetical protein [Cyanobacteria bacterium bin.51]